MRTLSFLFGILLLVDGIPSIFRPLFWVRYTDQNLKGTLPEPVTQTIKEFGALSDDAIRTKALTEVVVGLMLLFLSSLVTAQYATYSRWQYKQHEHSHPHKHGDYTHAHGHAHEHRHEHDEEERKMRREEAI
jgi:ABC-type nickel/cobalt efflux system permease component RcnA